MYRPKKDLTNQPIVLPKLDALPVLGDLMAAMQQAEKANGKWVEFSWMRPDTDSKLTLSVMFRAGGGAPVWVLKEGEHRNAEELWTYSTGDTGLIFNLAIAECTGIETVDNTPQPDQTQSIGGKALPHNTAFNSKLLGLQSTSSSRLPAFTLPKEAGPSTMEGDLADMPVPNLLQSFTMGKMTGRLLVHNKTESAQMYFEDGVLVHATADDLTGEDVVLELVTWDAGKFYFYREQKTTERSVQRRLDGMLMEGLTLLDQGRTLIEAGMTPDSYLDKRNRNLTEAEFENAVRSAAPVDLNLQKNFYLALDGMSSLAMILKKKFLTKKQWVPILYNLFKAELITIAAKSATPDKTSFLVPVAIDRVAIDSIERSFQRTDTGLVSYPHFQYLLEQEYSRCQLYRTQCSVIVMELWEQQKADMLPVSAVGLKEAFERVQTVKRKLDIISHFETLSYAMLLPHTDTAAAAILAYRIREVLLASNLQAIQTGQLSLAFGIAGLPEDCRDVGLLLSAAKASKQAAMLNNSPIVLFKDLQKIPV